VGIIVENPHETSLVMPRGLKGLLHMLNATISPTKVDLCFLFFICIFFFKFCFAKRLAKYKFGGI
jgi:hypothetical protein